MKTFIKVFITGAFVLGAGVAFGQEMDSVSYNQGKLNDDAIRSDSSKGTIEENRHTNGVDPNKTGQVDPEIQDAAGGSSDTTQVVDHDSAFIPPVDSAHRQAGEELSDATDTLNNGAGKTEYEREKAGRKAGRKAQSKADSIDSHLREKERTKHIGNGDDR
jgi:hypothetical protein